MEKVVSWSSGVDTESAFSKIVRSQLKRHDKEYEKFRDLSAPEQKKQWRERESAIAESADFQERMKLYAMYNGDTRSALMTKKEQLAVLKTPKETRRNMYNTAIESLVGTQRELIATFADTRHLLNHMQTKMLDEWNRLSELRFYDEAKDYDGAPEDFKGFGPSLFGDDEEEEEPDAEPDAEAKPELEEKKPEAEAKPELEEKKPELEEKKPELEAEAKPDEEKKAETEEKKPETEEKKPESISPTDAAKQT